MIRLSRTGATIRCGTCLVLAALFAVGCAQDGIGKGGLGGGTGTGGSKPGAGGGASGIAGAGDGAGGSKPGAGGNPATGGIGGGVAGFGGQSCPATPPTAGFSCAGGEFGFTSCQYGSATCCGVTYPTLQVTCQQDTVVQEALGNPCTGNAGYVCPAGGANGGGGVGGGGGGSGTCPTTPPANGAWCSGAERCSYGSQTCCGVTYADEVAICATGFFSIEYVETGCLVSGKVCPDASTETPNDAGTDALSAGN